MVNTTFLICNFTVRVLSALEIRLIERLTVLNHIEIIFKHRTTSLSHLFNPNYYFFKFYWNVTRWICNKKQPTYQRYLFYLNKNMLEYIYFLKKNEVNFATFAFFNCTWSIYTAFFGTGTFSILATLVKAWVYRRAHDERIERWNRTAASFISLLKLMNKSKNQLAVARKARKLENNLTCWHFDWFWN